MGVGHFGGQRDATASYSMRKLADGKRIFATECQGGEPGAIEMVRQKDGKRHKAGDIFYVKGGNAINGVIKGMWIRPGYNGAGKELSIGFASDDGTGKMVREFLQLPLLNEDGRIDNATARFLAALDKIDLGEEVTLAVHTFHHKAGDKMSENSDKVWEKDGDSVLLSVYQPHLATEDNPNGKIALEKSDFYVQPTFFIKGKQVIDITPDVKVPADAKVQYNGEDADAYATAKVEAVMSKVARDDKFQAPPAGGESGGPASEDDMRFGEEEQAARSRGQRPS